MAKALGFLLLFALTNASLLLLYPFSLDRLALVAVCFGSGTIVILLTLFHPRARWLGTGRCEVDSGGARTVALTFDDGPAEGTTPRVLAVLREKNVRATFFLVGLKVEKSPELARRTGLDGHVIGNHTYSHPPLFCFLAPGRLRQEITRAQEAIVEATGQRPMHFRSPVGLRHPLLGPTLERAGLAFVLWSLRSYDTRSHTPESLRRRILDRVRPGTIVLLHDRPGPGSEAMIAALPEVIDRLRADGYTFVTV